MVYRRRPPESGGNGPRAALAGKVVLATTNYIPDYTVKACSHLDAAEVPTTGMPAGSPNRRALAIAGDDGEAKQVASALYDAIG